MNLTQLPFLHTITPKNSLIYEYHSRHVRHVRRTFPVNLYFCLSYRAYTENCVESVNVSNHNRILSMTIFMKPRQTEFNLPGMTDGAEILELHGDNLAALDARLATEQRYIVILEVVRGRQYRATIAPLPLSARTTTDHDERRLDPGRFPLNQTQNQK